MKTKCPNRTSANENECPVPRPAWGHIGWLTAIVGVFALLMVNNGPLGAANSKPAKGETTGQGVAIVNPNSTAAALLSQGQPEQTRPIHPPGDAVQLQANPATRTGESVFGPSLVLGDMQGGAGRCDSSNVCHYSMALMEAANRETQAAGRSEAETVSFDPICAAKDLDATTRIEQLGITDEVSSDKLAAAGLMLMVARANCARGRVAEALEQYETLLVHTLASAGAR